MIYHTIVIDVNSGTCMNSSRETIDIKQGDKNVHQLLIKLVKDGKFYHLVEGTRAEVSFYDSFDNEMFTSLAANVVNPYRGYVSYVIGERLVKDCGRYVGRLCLFNQYHDQILSARFILNVSKDMGGMTPRCCPDQTEVVITRAFYKDLVDHMRDNRRHMTQEYYDLIDFIADNRCTFITYDNLGEALAEDPEIQGVLQDTVNKTLFPSSASQSVLKILANAEIITPYATTDGSVLLSEEGSVYIL